MIFYVGPTIIGVATRNTAYADVPDGLEAAIKQAPYMAGLCVSTAELGNALQQISSKSGAIYTLYEKALDFKAQN